MIMPPNGIVSTLGGDMLDLRSCEVLQKSIPMIINQDRATSAWVQTGARCIQIIRVAPKQEITLPAPQVTIKPAPVKVVISNKQ